MSDKMFKIRLMKVEELGRVRDLIVQLQIYQKMKDIPRLPSVQDLKNELLYEVDGKRIPNKCGTFVVVAIDESRLNEPDLAYIIGYLIYSLSFSILEGQQFYMNSFFIEEEYRRHGLGRKFMEFMRLHGITAGIKRVDIPYMNDNLIGQKFYKTYGAYSVNDEYAIMGIWLKDKTT